MKTMRIWLAATVFALGAASLRAGDVAPTPVSGTLTTDVGAPCAEGKAPAPCAANCAPSSCGKGDKCRGTCEKLRDWLFYCSPSGRGCCLPGPNCNCTPSPYVFFLDRCQPLAGECPSCAAPPAEPACRSCGMMKGALDWARNRKPLLSRRGGDCEPACADAPASLAPAGWLRSRLGW